MHLLYYLVNYTCGFGELVFYLGNMNAIERFINKKKITSQFFFLRENENRN